MTEPSINHEARSIMIERKVIVVVGSSPVGWDDAVKQVVKKVSQAVETIAGIDVVHQSARVERGEIVDYRATVQISFTKDAAARVPHSEPLDA